MLVSWWASLYSRRGLPLRGRGAYGPVLTHGPRVASLSLRGAKAVVWRPLKMKGCHYYKTIQPPWRAMEKRPPFGALRHHLSPAKFGRATKGKRPYGQARRLTSLDLIILCRIATWGRSLRYVL